MFTYDQASDSAGNFKLWFIGRALPLWASRGVDPETGAHFERFNSNGALDQGCDLRVRVQARQVFSYAMACHLGWSTKSYQIAEQIFRFLLSCRRSSGEYVFVRLLRPDLTVADSDQDLYDHAFILLACAWLYKATSLGDALVVADGVQEFLERELASPYGGWVEGNYAHRFRRQNPHMHLFEAYLSLYEATGCIRWLDLSRHILELFKKVFFDESTQTVRELFDSDWGILGGGLSDVIEPGHMFEWVWLLRNYQRLSGHDTGFYADALYEKAYKIGYCEDTGLIYDEVWVSGCPKSKSTRLWVMTEFIKANIAQAEYGQPQCGKRALLAVGTLMTAYVKDIQEGLYIDQVKSDMSLKNDSCMASSMYHLMLACREVDMYFRDSI